MTDVTPEEGRRLAVRIARSSPLYEGSDDSDLPDETATALNSFAAQVERLTAENNTLRSGIIVPWINERQEKADARATAAEARLAEAETLLREADIKQQAAADLWESLRKRLWDDDREGLCTMVRAYRIMPPPARNAPALGEGGPHE